MAQELQFNNYFARVHFDSVQKNVKNQEQDIRNQKLPKQLSVIEQNRLAWNRSKDPIVEFVNRQ